MDLIIKIVVALILFSILKHIWIIYYSHIRSFIKIEFYKWGICLLIGTYYSQACKMFTVHKPICIGTKKQ
jgi:hypothetical protein